MYALLTMMIVQVCDLEPSEFVHTLGDAHLYINHFDQLATQLSRTPKLLPVMKINPYVTDLFAFTFDDFTLEEYEADPSETLCHDWELYGLTVASLQNLQNTQIQKMHYCNSIS